MLLILINAYFTMQKNTGIQLFLGNGQDEYSCGECRGILFEKYKVRL